MKSNNREILRIRFYSYYEKYKKLRNKFTSDHFISEGEKQTTIYDIINRFESGKNAKHQSGGSRPDMEWILNDESYFTKTNFTINGNDNFYSDNIDFAPCKI